MLGLQSRRKKWDRALAEHSEAIDRYLATIEQLDEHLWVQPYKPEGWNPAQITHHLVLYYEAVAEVAAGDLTLQYRAGPLMRTVLGIFLVPHILFHGKFPIPAVAPREVRPKGDPVPQADAPAVFRKRARHGQAMLATLWDDPRRRIGHPYFGPMKPLRFLRLSMVHLDHHRGQVERVIKGASA